jgi:hypothetical protein
MSAVLIGVQDMESSNINRQYKHQVLLPRKNVHNGKENQHRSQKTNNNPRFQKQYGKYHHKKPSMPPREIAPNVLVGQQQQQQQPQQQQTMHQQLQYQQPLHQQPQPLHQQEKFRHSQQHYHQTSLSQEGKQLNPNKWPAADYRSSKPNQSQLHHADGKQIMKPHNRKQFYRQLSNKKAHPPPPPNQDAMFFDLDNVPRVQYPFSNVRFPIAIDVGLELELRQIYALTDESFRQSALFNSPK